MHLVSLPVRTMRQSAGFTLIEILLVVAVVSVMAAMTVPTVAGAMDRYYILSAGQQVASTIRAARFQAVARNRLLELRFDTDAGTYQVFDDTTNVAVGNVQTLTAGVSFDAGTVDIPFETDGRPTAGACPCTIIVTDGNAAYDRTVTVSTSGRVQLE